MFLNLVTISIKVMNDDEWTVFFFFICRFSCLHCVHVSFHFNALDKEGDRHFQLLTSPRESRAGVKDSSPLPRPETLQQVEDMAKKLLIQDEVAAVMRHCQRVSSQSEITVSNTSVSLCSVCFSSHWMKTSRTTYRLKCAVLFPVSVSVL